jgi:predicted phage baseplate assembly protein
MRARPDEAMPSIALTGTVDGRDATWRPLRDLLNARPDTPAFVIESESDATAVLRFGDDAFGMRPQERTAFSAVYRVGNGPAGNVGAGALSHVVSGDPAIEGVRNPLPASGGLAPESIEDVRQRAPVAFRTQRRAVTADDYARVAGSHAEVQRAAASIRWTGSWRTVFVAADRFGGRPVDDAFEEALARHLEPFRMAGQDVEIEPARSVSLAVTMVVCVAPTHFRAHVAAALLDVFSSRTLPDGRRGVFHPDHFTFGQPLYLSTLYRAAQRVDGVESVHVTRFERLDQPGPLGIDTGRLAAAGREILRLDNDRNFPERGVFELVPRGGK